MLAILTRLFVMLCAVWFVRRWLRALLRGGPRSKTPDTSSGETSQTTSKMVKDPICGMYMDPRLALRLEGNGGAFYFCSDECRQKFTARPL